MPNSTKICKQEKIIFHCYSFTKDSIFISILSSFSLSVHFRQNHIFFGASISFYFYITVLNKFKKKSLRSYVLSRNIKYFIAFIMFKFLNNLFFLLQFEVNKNSCLKCHLYVDLNPDFIHLTSQLR